MRLETADRVIGAYDMLLAAHAKSIEAILQSHRPSPPLHLFTYIDDITDGVIKVLDNPANPNPDWNPQNPTPESSSAPYKIYNIGNNQPVSLMKFIETIETKLGKTAQKEMLPMQPGDVQSTYADVTGLINDMDYKPNTPLDEGVEKFVMWYRKFYQLSSTVVIKNSQ